MDKKENLMPIEEVNARRTREQRSEDSRKAGKASGKARRRNARLKETLLLLGATPLKKGSDVSIEEVNSIAEAKGLNLTAEETMALAVVRRAAEGDLKAIEFYRDSTGQKPDNKVDVKTSLPVFIYGEDKIPD